MTLELDVMLRKSYIQNFSSTCQLQEVRESAENQYCKFKTGIRRKVWKTGRQTNQNPDVQRDITIPLYFWSEKLSYKFLQKNKHTESIVKAIQVTHRSQLDIIVMEPSHWPRYCHFVSWSLKHKMKVKDTHCHVASVDHVKMNSWCLINLALICTVI